MNTNDQIPAGLSTSGRIPILLGNAGYYGTLAAVRSLGRAGIPVVTMGTSLLDAGRHSRFVSSHLTCPPFEQTSRWAEWLADLGRKGPRRAIYATSDVVSYALAHHCRELEVNFALCQPDLSVMLQILDKGRLYAAARAVGLETPETWLPTSRAEAASIADTASGIVLAKPRSQLAVRNKTKGAVAGVGKNAIMSAYDALSANFATDSDFARRHPEVMKPMLQRYHAETMHSVYSVAGFRDQTGRHVAMLASDKVLQRPRRLGVGLCFEAAPLDASLAGKLTRLCESIGYYGAFEAEFIRCGAHAMLIDFNARLYNQVSFEVARGLDLPRLVYAAAVGDSAEVERLTCPSLLTDAKNAYCNRLGFELSIRTQRALGSMTREDAANWRAWRNAPGRQVVDAVGDRDDPLPAICDATQQALQFLRHPRAFVRQLSARD
jgi:predicted ATP-grasp superfamily ATP-dependent carboligase